MKTILLLALLLGASACCWDTGNTLDVCADIEASTNDAGYCTFTPTHPPFQFDGGE